MDINYRTSPDVILLQSQFMEPKTISRTPWTLFHCKTKTSFLVHNESIIETLTYASSATNLKTLKSYTKTDNTLQKLIDKGILIQSEQDKKYHYQNITEHYHSAVFDYPFLDYNTPTWMEDDRKLMSEYLNHQQPPSIYKDHEGKSIELPEPNIKDFDLLGDITLESLSNILYVTLGKLKEKDTYTGKLLKKTSPSGGGRHPVEGVLILKKTLSGISPGVYAYGVKNHVLIRLNVNFNLSIVPENVLFGLVLAIEPERAMWRYRDIRAFRPVLMDVGHMVETFHLVVNSLNMKTESMSISYANFIGKQIGLNWLKEPALSLIFVTKKESSSHKNEYRIDDSRDKYLHESRYVLNPFLWLSFYDRSIICNVSYPKVKSIPISPKDIKLLTQFIEPREIHEMKEDQKFIEILKEDGIVVPADKIVHKKKDVQLWSDYGWYLSLLNHSYTIHSYNESIFAYQSDVVQLDNLVGSLLSRETTRKFVDISISEDSFRYISKSAFTNLPNLKATVFVFIFNVDGIQPGLYRMNMEKGEFKLTLIVTNISRNELQTLTIGQKPASEGNFTIVIVNQMDIQSSMYEDQLIELGRLGQRICLSATDIGLGIFLTPAVCDQTMFSRLKLQPEVPYASYLFSIGVRGE